MSSMTVTLIIVLLACTIAFGFGTIYFFIRLINLSKQYDILSKKKDKLFDMVSEESNQRASYQARCLELEDAIKEGVGVSLRKEVTRVHCIFDQHELNAVLEGARYLIREYYKSSQAVKFYVKLIEKIEQNLALMIAEKEAENPPV